MIDKTIIESKTHPKQHDRSTEDSSAHKHRNTEVKERTEVNLQELIRQYKANRVKGDGIDSDSSSCFVSSSEDDNDQFNNDPQAKKNFIKLYRKEHGGIIIYDVEGNIPGQPAPDYDGSDYDDIEMHNKENYQSPIQNQNIDSLKNKSINETPKNKESILDSSVIEKNVFDSPLVQKRHPNSCIQRSSSVIVENNILTHDDPFLFDESEIRIRKLKSHREYDKNILYRK